MDWKFVKITYGIWGNTHTHEFDTPEECEKFMNGVNEAIYNNLKVYTIDNEDEIVFTFPLDPIPSLLRMEKNPNENTLNR